MEWRRVKTILIALFIAIDVALAVNLFVIRDIYIQKYDSAISDALDIAEKKGVYIEKKTIPKENRKLSAFEVMTDEITSGEVIEMVIGASNMVEESAGVFNYISGGNVATARPGGIFEISMLHDKSDNQSDEDISKNLIKKIDRSRLSLNQTDPADPFGYKQYIDNIPVFNSEVKIEIAGRAVKIDGRCAVGRKNALDMRVKTAYELVLDITEFFKGSDSAVTVTGIKQGYYMNAATGGKLRVMPTWEVETQEGYYYFDMTTGEPSSG